MKKTIIIPIVIALFTSSHSNSAYAAFFSIKLPNISALSTLSVNNSWNFDIIANRSADLNSTKTEIVNEEEIQNKLTILKSYTVRATAYSSTVDQTDDTPFITASGTTVRDGIIATNFLPFGTTIRIPEIYGDKLFVVEDRMNKRYWHNIDIWFPEREIAKEFGAKKVKIEVVINTSVI